MGKPVRSLRHLAMMTLVSTLVFSMAWGWYALGRWLWRPSLVFMVYPGNQKYQDRFILRAWLRNLPFPDILPIGLIQADGAWGVCATTIHILTEVDPTVLDRTTSSIRRFFPGARSVSLAGRWPSLLAKAGFSTTQSPLVDGTLGTVYAMDRVCSSMAVRRGMPEQDTTICILGGGGFVGRMLLPRLKGRYRNVIAIDPCYEASTDNDGLICTAEAAPLAQADIVLVLTPCGDDALPYADHAVDGQLWGDDTFPDMHAATRTAFEAKGVTVLKTALVDRTLRFLPELPTFGNNVPGCLVAAMVNERHPGLTDPEAFYRAADALGFDAQLFAHGRR